jgi:hypothetical protein
MPVSQEQIRALGIGLVTTRADCYKDFSFKAPGVVVHNYNSSYLGDRDWENQGSRSTQAKKMATFHLNK